MKALRIALFLLALPCLAWAQSDPTNFPRVDVCTARADGDGDCVVDAIGDTVCVQGVVLAWHEFGTRGPGAIYDPQSGCCISVFDIDAYPNVARGDLIEACGWVTDFPGLAEISDNPANGAEDPVVTVISAGNPFPCTLVACSDLADNSPTAEGHESCLVSLCGRFSLGGALFQGNTNYDFVDANGDTCDVRIDFDVDIVGTPIPVGDVSVKGVFAQFNNFNSDCTGYQVLPRDLGDIVTDDCVVAVENETWGRVKDAYREDD